MPCLLVHNNTSQPYVKREATCTSTYQQFSRHVVNYFNILEDPDAVRAGCIAQGN